MNDNTEKIREYLNKIHELKSKIKEYENEIDILNGLTEICPHCKGEGRFMTVHRMFDSHSYMNCCYCHGKKKVTKEQLLSYKSNF